MIKYINILLGKIFTAWFKPVVSNGNAGETLTIDFTLGQDQKIVLNEVSCDITVTPITEDGCWKADILIKQDATGGRNVNFTNVVNVAEFDFTEGPAPTELVIEDLQVGNGTEAGPGQTVTVHYAGIDFETGEQFDSSWDRGESIEFRLKGLIFGWQEGIPGMKVGGRRKLTIPPEMAYGPAGSGHRLSGKTLVFIIDLLAVS